MTYNRRSLLPRAVKSVLSQTFRDFEYIVIDDASSDGTPDVVEPFDDPRLVYVRNETNLGMSNNRNKAIAMARGRYIAFLDDDDEWLDRKLEAQMEVFGTSPVSALGVVYTSVVNVWNDGDERVAWAQHRGDVRGDLLREGYIIKGGLNSALIVRDAFDRVGPIDPSNPSRDDYDFFVRLSGSYGFDFVAKPMVRITKFGSDRATTNDRYRILGLIRVLKRHRDIYLETPASRYFADHMMIAKHLAWMGRPRMAWKMYRYALHTTRPPSLRWIHTRDLAVVPVQIFKTMIAGARYNAARDASNS